MTLEHLWLIRHGESQANVAATRAEREGLEVVPIDIRDADVPLSPDGEEQAGALADWLAAHHGDIDAWYTSPYLRARQTLAIGMAGAGVEAEVVVDERLRDRELGVLDLLTRRGVAARHPEEAARRRHLGKYYHRPPGGESWADVSLRLRSFLADAAATPAQSALVVAHDAVVMLVMGLLVGMDEGALLAFADDHTVLNASVTHLVRDGSRYRVEAFADVAHLQHADAPVTVHPGSPDVEPR